MKETRDLLMRTKRLFTSGHWTKGALFFEAPDDEQNEQTYYCLVGGLRLSAGHADVYSKPNDPAYLEAIDLLAREIGSNELAQAGTLTKEQTIVIFNDRFAKDSDEVVALIDRVVEKVPS